MFLEFRDFLRFRLDTHGVRRGGGLNAGFWGYLVAELCRDDEGYDCSFFSVASIP